MTEALLVELAERFWSAAGDERDLASAVPSALPVAVVSLPAITIARVEAWLARHGTHVSLHGANRRLRGGLVAHAGLGIVFVDGGDPAEERRFTLAHEVAHFLLDYLSPRERAIRLLGDGIAEVLDGIRSPSAQERTDAALAACQLGIHVDLLERDGDRGALTAGRETRADRLAWELLAPAEGLVRAGLCGAAPEDLGHVLQTDRGFPAAQAAAYARALRRDWGLAPSFVDWLSP